MRYRLAPQVSFCETGHRLVFLDVATDRYFCLEPPMEAAFRAAMANDPRAPADTLQTLIARGVLIAGEGLLASTTPPPEPRHSAFDFLERRGLQPLRTMRAVAALIGARGSLRKRGLAATLDALAHVTVNDRRTPAPNDADSVAVALAFRTTQLLVSPLDQCLPRSIALATLLFREGASASFVMGVRLRPFLAHSWVQAGDVVLNDRPDTVRTFTPILVI